MAERESQTEKVRALAERVGVSVATVYNRAKKLGRLPTEEELRVAAKRGRPAKYK